MARKESGSDTLYPLIPHHMNPHTPRKSLDRKTIKALSMCILTFFFFSIPYATAQTLLVSHWNFDEGVGTIAFDQTGNSHDATLQGSSSWDTGHIGTNSVILDGSGSLNIANPDPLRIASGDYSFFGWINTTKNQGYSTIIADRNSGSTGEGFFFRVGKSSGDGELFLHLGSGVERKQYATVSANLNDGIWHHVGFTWENETDTLRLYIDGAQITNIRKSVDHPLAGDSIASSNNLKIGRRPNGAQPFEGSIDDVRIYQSVLNAAEVLTLFSGGPTINILEPDGNDTADQTFTIIWADDDPDHDASIALYYDLDSFGADGTLIVNNLSEDDESDQFVWDVSLLFPGSYYVYGVIENGQDLAVTSYSSGPVTINHGNAASVADDSLDFSELIDAMTVDATTTFDLDTNAANLNFDNDTLFISSANNRIGIGTVNPSEKLSVNGVIESEAGGFKFPDGTVQTTASNSSPVRLKDIVTCEYSGSVGTTMTCLHNLGRVPQFISAKMISHSSTGQAVGNWSTGQWQNNAAGFDQRTETYHGSVAITYVSPILHVANNPSVDWHNNHYVRATITAVSDTSIMLLIQNGGTELDGRIHRMIFHVE